MTKEKVEKAVSEIEIVEMTDGRKVSFSGRSKLKSETTIENGLITIVFDARNGDTYTLVHPTTCENEFDLQVLAYGLENKIKAAIAGVEVKELLSVITLKAEEFSKGVFVSRSSSSQKLSITHQAWGIAHNYDPKDVSDILKISTELAQMSKEDRKLACKTPAVLLEKARLEMAIAESNVEQTLDKEAA